MTVGQIWWTLQCVFLFNRREASQLVFFKEWSPQWQEANYCELETVPSHIYEMAHLTRIHLPYSFRTGVWVLLYPLPIDKKG